MNESVNWNIVASYAKGIWAVSGPLLGVLVGGWITSRIQSRQWMANNRKEEYRELLTTLTNAAASLIDNAQMNVGTIPVNAIERQLRQNNTKGEYDKSLRVLEDRLFIAREVEEMDLFDRWSRAMADLQETNNYRTFEDRFAAMKRDIIGHATKT